MYKNEVLKTRKKIYSSAIRKIILVSCFNNFRHFYIKNNNNKYYARFFFFLQLIVILNCNILLHLLFICAIVLGITKKSF